MGAYDDVFSDVYSLFKRTSENLIQKVSTKESTGKGGEAPWVLQEHENKQGIRKPDR